MKALISLFVAGGVLCVAGCQKNSETTENPSDTNMVTSPTNSLESEMKTNASAVEGELKTNVVAPITNSYMSTTNSLMGTNR